MTKAIVGLLLLLLGLTDLASAQNSPDSLVGLWRARRWFGPDVRGPVVVRRQGTVFSADLNGRVLPVRLEQGELRFDLPEGRGSFRGKPPTSEGIVGVWTPQRSLANGGFTTSLFLRPDGSDRWRGEIVPYDDVFTYWLLVQKRPDGTFSALLRNLERDYGALLGVKTLVSDAGGVRLIGKPPWERRDTTVARGTYDAETSTLTLAFPSRGGAYEFRRDGDSSEFYPRGRRPARYAYRAPLSSSDGWPTGTLASAGIDQAAIERAVQAVIDMPMDSVDAPQVHGLLIARHGRLVLEEYFHGEHRDKLHETRSGSKSLTATLIGAAMQAGAPLKLSSPVYQVMNGGSFPANLEPRKRAMTLENLLTMTSGYFCDDNNSDAPGSEEVMGDQDQEPDFYRYTLNVPMAFDPGDTAIYCSANPNLALGMLARATGEFPPILFHRLVGKPLEITRIAWPLDPAGQAYGGGSMQILPRDFMKLGQLMLDDGVWKGHRILSHEFVARASSPLYPIGSRRYGFLWWCMNFSYRGKTVAAYAALGTGGQTVTVFPTLDLVITTYGGSYSSRGYRYMQAELIPNLLLPAVSP